MYEKSQSIFAKNLYFYRKRLKLTQKQLASIINCTASYIGQLENMQAGLKLHTIELIADALQVTPADLFISETQKESIIAEEVEIPYNPQLEKMISEIRNVLNNYESKSYSFIKKDYE